MHYLSSMRISSKFANNTDSKEHAFTFHIKCFMRCTRYSSSSRWILKLNLSIFICWVARFKQVLWGRTTKLYDWKWWLKFCLIWHRRATLLPVPALHAHWLVASPVQELFHKQHFYWPLFILKWPDLHVYLTTTCHKSRTPMARVYGPHGFSGLFWRSVLFCFANLVCFDLFLFCFFNERRGRGYTDDARYNLMLYFVVH